MTLDQKRQLTVNAAEVEDRSFPYQIKAVAVGDFVEGTGAPSSIAVLTENDSVLLLSDSKSQSVAAHAEYSVSRKHGLTNEPPPGPPVTASAHSSHDALRPTLHSALNQRTRHLAASEKNSPLGDWRADEVFHLMGAGPESTRGVTSSAAAQPSLVTTRTSCNPADNILVTFPGKGGLHIIDLTSGPLTTATPTVAYLETEGEPVAVLPMHLNSDALKDTVMLLAGQTSVSVALTQPQSAFSVTTTDDSGSGSLRQAIMDANNSPGADLITFNIPGAGTLTIRPATALPAITDSVTIDGTSQPGYTGKPVIELDGTDAVIGGPFVAGLLITGGNSSVGGLAINRFGGGIDIAGSKGGDIVTGTFIGTDASGTVGLGDLFTGLTIRDGSNNNTIGGTTAAARNVLSGNGGVNNAFEGLRIFNSTGNQILGNFVGTDASGVNSIQNFGNGIVIGFGGTPAAASNNLFAGNVISGNSPQFAGIAILDSGSSGNLIQGNLIGTDHTGASALGNGGGVEIIDAAATTVGGTAAKSGNVVSGNQGIGVFIAGAATETLLQGNLIGTSTGSSGSTASASRMPINPSATATLAITISASSNPVASGTRLTYTIAVQNSGPDTATDVTVAASIPNGTTFASITTSQGSATNPVVGGTGGAAVSLGSIPSGSTGTIRLVVNVLAPAGVTLSATASMTSSSTNPNQSNSSVTTATTVKGGGVVSVAWQQPPSTNGNPTPAPRVTCRRSQAQRRALHLETGESESRWSIPQAIPSEEQQPAPEIR